MFGLSVSLFFVLICSSYFVRGEDSTGGVESHGGLGNKTENITVDNDLILYQRLYRTKRKEQQEMANSLMAVSDFAKQYTVVSRLVLRMIEVLTKSNATVNSSNFIPGVSKFPNASNEQLREAVANVVENIVLFGDMALRCPDAMDEVFRVHKAKKWRPIIAWAHGFANQSGVVTGSDTKVLQLMAQELKLEAPDSSYQNPYRKPKMSTAEWEKLRKDKAKKEKEAKRAKRKKERKGPRLAGEL